MKRCTCGITGWCRRLGRASAVTSSSTITNARIRAWSTERRRICTGAGAYGHDRANSEEEHCRIGGSGRVGRRRAANVARFLHPLIEPDVRFSRIRLSDHLLPAACAAILPNGSPFLPSGTADIGHVGSDTPIVAWQSARGTGACAEAITATRSGRPNPPYGMSGCCCQPGNRYTTHSGLGSASGPLCRPARWTETIALLREPVDGYCGTPFRAATSEASAPVLSETRSRGTRNLPPALS